MKILTDRGFDLDTREDSFVCQTDGRLVHRKWTIGIKDNTRVCIFESEGFRDITVEWLDKDRIAEGFEADPTDYPPFTDEQLCELLDTGVIAGHELYSSWED